MKRTFSRLALVTALLLSMVACAAKPQEVPATITTTTVTDTQTTTATDTITTEMATTTQTTTISDRPISNTVSTKPSVTVTTRGSTTTKATTTRSTATTRPVVDDSLYGRLLTDGEFPLHSFYKSEAMQLAEQLDYVRFVDEDHLEVLDDVPVTSTAIRLPDTQFNFLHESAVIEFKGEIFAAWYSCPKKELQGYTPIHGARSSDGGKTWTTMAVWADDPSGVEMYCAPAFVIENNTLYMFVNTMRGFDNINSLELYKWNETTKTFDKQWRRTMNFKMNANPILLSNGKLVIAGRTGEMGKNPLNPAILVSDNGKVNGEWRIVQVDDTKVQAPETSLLEIGDKLYLFCRNEPGSVGTYLAKAEAPIVYVSNDYGKTWSEPATHDIPLRAVKLYAGTFSDGRHYVIGNTERAGRVRLTMYISEPNSARFTKRIVLYDDTTTTIKNSRMCHYPCVYEKNGRVYITATVNYANTGLGDDIFQIRGLQMFTMNLADL